MSNQCLLTKLKGTVTDDSLPKLGYFEFTVSSNSTTADAVRLTINKAIIMNLSKSISINIAGGGYNDRAAGDISVSAGVVLIRVKTAGDQVTIKLPKDSVTEFSVNSPASLIATEYCSYLTNCGQLNINGTGADFTNIKLNSAPTVIAITEVDAALGNIKLDLTDIILTNITSHLRLHSAGIKLPNKVINFTSPDARIDFNRVKTNINLNSSVTFGAANLTNGQLVLKYTDVVCNITTFLDALNAKKSDPELIFTRELEISNAPYVTGDISNAPFLVFSSNDSVTYTWTSRSLGTMIALDRVRLSNIDTMLIDQAAKTVHTSASGRSKTINVIGTRTSASDAAVATLQGKGVSVVVTAP